MCAPGDELYQWTVSISSDPLPPRLKDPLEALFRAMGAAVGSRRD